MENLFSAAFVAVMMAIVLAVKVGPLIGTPKSDGPRIKRDYESNGRRVVELERAGFEVGGRSSPGYRKYAIVVVSPLGGQRRYVVGVSHTWFGDPELKEY
ncbi:MAG: hypothetical protein J7515_19890 [Caulobacter sp.]|nr:hypothetical protein [Caulobacter sp.]